MTTRGMLRVYLGAAPGVGKTYKMLEEGRRRLERGTDVVVGFVETHDRPATAAMLDGLEIVPRKDMTYRGAAFTELDLDAVLARRPEVALVDELAHTNVPGSANAKRWQDIERLLEAGIDVLTTVNVQHLELLNDVVRQITGVPQRETVPDAVVRRAEQIELVDMTPEALRRRMAHGNVYKPEKIDAALGNYFRVGNLTALRELALIWLADKVDEQLDRYRAEHSIDQTWEARERVVVALTGGPEGDTLIRRAARIAARTKGADVMAVHVVRGDGLAGADPADLTRQRLLIESLGGTYHQVLGSDIPAALLDFARGVNATQLVLGASRRGRFAQVLAPGVGVTTTALSGPIDVHLVTHEAVKQGRLRLGSGGGGLTRRRRVLGFALAGAGLPLLTVGLDLVRADVALPTDILAYLVLAVAVALIGGLYPALLCAVGGFLLLNYFFTPPLYGFTIAERENVLALIAFVFVAIAVSTVVDRAARRAREAARASAEAQTLATLAGSVLHGDNPLDALLERVRESFGLTSVTLLERHSERDRWRIVSAVGDRPCTTPAEGQTEVPVDDDLSLVLRGHPLQAADRRLIEAFAAHAAVALRQQRLGEQAAAARSLAEVDKLRTALLSAVSHDLRTPLASAKAAVGSLRSPDVEFSAEEPRRGLLARRHRRTPGHCRGVHGQAHAARGEPARHVPRAGRRRRPGPAGGQRRRGRAPRDRRPRPVRRRRAHQRPPGPARRRRRPGVAGTRPRQRPGQRRAIQPARQPAEDQRQPARRAGGHSYHRPRSWHPHRRPGSGLPAVPAPRRPRQHHRRRPRPRSLPRPGRGDGRDAAA
jgi:two-component system sensor histidine kinase KdpD